MAKFGFGKGLGKMLQDAVQTTKDAVENIDLSGVQDKLHETSDAVKGVVENVDLSEVRGKLQETGDAVMESVKKVGSPVMGEPDGAGELQQVGDIPEVEDAAAQSVASESSQEVTIATRDAIKIIYYLMAVDGTIHHDEEEKFDDIGSELDPSFADNREQIIAECHAQLGKVIEQEEYYDVLREGVEDVLSSTRPTDDAFITPRLLLWDLLTVAYSDEECDETELRLIRYIVRKTGVDQAVFLEMQSSILTVRDIERELAWIKSTDRPYIVIEAMVNELVDRRNVVFESVKDLVFL